MVVAEGVCAQEFDSAASSTTTAVLAIVNQGAVTIDVAAGREVVERHGALRGQIQPIAVITIHGVESGQRDGLGCTASVIQLDAITGCSGSAVRKAVVIAIAVGSDIIKRQSTVREDIQTIGVVAVEEVGTGQRDAACAIRVVDIYAVRRILIVAGSDIVKRDLSLGKHLETVSIVVLEQTTAGQGDRLGNSRLVVIKVCAPVGIRVGDQVVGF